MKEYKDFDCEDLNLKKEKIKKNCSHKSSSKKPQWRADRRQAKREKEERLGINKKDKKKIF